ncbi:MAG: hypothetical protein NVSMB62_08760 [Acidobacteriaceae bacterium]
MEQRDLKTAKEGQGSLNKMDFLPRTIGTRPRLACEIRPEGIVAARADENSSLLAAVSRVEFGPGAAVPQLRSIATGPAQATLNSPESEVPVPATLTAPERTGLVGAVRKALEAVALRTREISLVVPDSAVRVLLLDFDALPGKAAEALPIVRFRLKKLLPFDADHAAISYQVMSSVRGLVRVLAVAMPQELLTDYESIVREAGFEPGAVLPSTLAAVAGLPEGDAPALVINAGRQGVTTAIARAGILLLHRSVDLGNLAERSAVPTVAADYGDPIATVSRLQTVERERDADPAGTSQELAQAVSVAAAYFEDTLASEPRQLLASGTLGAAALQILLADSGMETFDVEEIVSSSHLGASLSGQDYGGRVPSGWLAGVRGALAS